eukprot:scaffold250540_cov13-Tisochrysis_lutea.AAC.1
MDVFCFGGGHAPVLPAQVILIHAVCPNHAWQALTLFTTFGDLKLELFCDQVRFWRMLASLQLYSACSRGAIRCHFRPLFQSRPHSHVKTSWPSVPAAITTAPFSTATSKVLWCKE